MGSENELSIIYNTPLSTLSIFDLRKSKEEIERLKMHREQQNRILEQQRSKEIENQKAEEQKIANQVGVFVSE